MRPRVPWISQADDRILEFLEAKEIGATPGVIAYNIDYHNRHIARRCRHLAEVGMLENTDGTIYELTQFGRDYLAGDVDAVDLEAARPEDEGDEKS